MTDAEREANNNNEECRASNPSPTVPVVGWGFIPGVPIKLIVWVSKVDHLKPPLQMPGQRAARRMGFRFGMSISNGGLAIGHGPARGLSIQSERRHRSVLFVFMQNDGLGCFL
jgi:hypothetical protein